VATWNAQYAARLERIADVLELKGENRFRVSAYRRAARALEEGPDLGRLVDPEAPEDLSALMAIDGVGEAMAEKAVELVTRGEIAEYKAQLREVPPGVLELLEVPELGPKTVGRFWREAGIDSPAALAHAIEHAPEKLLAMKGVGKKSLEKMARNLAFAAGAGRRVRADVARRVALQFASALGELEGVGRVDFAGSLRRGRETVGDLDLVAGVTADGAAVSEAFCALEPVAEVIARGPTKTSVRTGDGLQVDLRLVRPEAYGAALMYFTGSKDHNVRLRQRAIERGGKLSEYGFFREGAQAPEASETEEAVYRALGLDWIPPELREGRAEIELAARGALPRLVRESDLAAELHAHTTASDGRWSIRALAEAAAARGCHTVAVTDHSVSQRVAGGLSAAALRDHLREVRRVAEALAGTIRVLAGAEVDILADGSLDYEDALLAELDLVVASPHAALGQGPEAATDRLLRAIEHPAVTILGHPTGRLIGRREGLSPRMDRIIEAARARGIALEVNAHARRLDLRDAHAREAIEAGVKLALNTDAHGPEDFEQRVYGLATCRRAGAGPGDIVNCLGAEDLAAWIAGTRG